MCTHASMCSANTIIWTHAPSPATLKVHKITLALTLYVFPIIVCTFRAVCVCACAYMCACACMCARACKCVRSCVCTRMHVRVRVHVCVRMRLQVCVCLRVHARARVTYFILLYYRL